MWLEISIIRDTCTIVFSPSKNTASGICYAIFFTFETCKPTHSHAGSATQFEGGENDDRRFFYHTSRTRQLDEMLGDIHHRVVGALNSPYHLPTDPLQ